MFSIVAALTFVVVTATPPPPPAPLPALNGVGMLQGVQSGSLAQANDGVFVARGSELWFEPRKGTPTVVAHADAQDGRIELVAARDDDVFFTTHRKLFRMMRASGAPQTIAQAPQPTTSGQLIAGIGALAVDDDDVYFTVGKSVLHVALGGEGPHAAAVLDDVTGDKNAVPGALCVQGPWLAFAVGHDVLRMPRVGGIAHVFVHGDDDVRALVADGEDLLVLSAHHVSRVDASGAVTSLATVSDGVALAADRNALWIADRAQGLLRVQRADGGVVVISGHPVTDVVHDEALVSFIVRDGPTMLSHAQKQAKSHPVRANVGDVVLGCADGLVSACEGECQGGTHGDACLAVALPILEGHGGVPSDPLRALPLLQRACDAPTPSVKACVLAATLTGSNIPPLHRDEKRTIALQERACTLDEHQCGPLAETLADELDVHIVTDSKHIALLRKKLCDADYATVCLQLAHSLQPRGKNKGDPAGAKAALEHACSLNAKLAGCP